MGNVALHVENLGKRYQIGARQGRYRTFRESLVEACASPFRRVGHLVRGRNNGTADSQEAIWALKDVSFEVKHGEVIGIIGRNGAGKSTLLKILSRITEPTKGHANLYGRIGSLLEVGTGFHPELTGRENIYLNGAILGMKKAEIVRRFDEIVAFAEIEKFIDTPVKHYSSGMYVRLAFGVAAHLEPEILIVDEVLAVGDAAFQKKCMGKMGEVATEGRTVLFVSHNMGAISSLCGKTVYLKDGQIEEFDLTSKVIPTYLGSNTIKDYDGIKVRSFTTNSNGNWEKGGYVAVEVSWGKNKFPPGWQCDIAGYTLEGTKVFAAESHKLEGFSSHNEASNCITFFVENIGFLDTPLRIDIEIRDTKKYSYKKTMENCLLVKPDGGSLPPYSRNDVVVVPNIYCQVDTR